MKNVVVTSGCRVIVHSDSHSEIIEKMVGSETVVARGLLDLKSGEMAIDGEVALVQTLVGSEYDVF